MELCSIEGQLSAARAELAAQHARIGSLQRRADRVELTCSEARAAQTAVLKVRDLKTWMLCT